MSGSTTRRGYYKAGGGSTGAYGADESADIDVAVNNNLDKIDAFIGAPVLTSVPNCPSPLVGDRCIVGGVEYRHNGSVWRAWESEWISYSVSTAGMPSSTTASGSYRYVHGDIEFQAVAIANGTGGSGSLMLTLPTNALAGSRMRSALGEIGRPGTATFQAIAALASNNQIFVYTTKTDGAYGGYDYANNGKPLTWQANDYVFACGFYQPA